MDLQWAKEKWKLKNVKVIYEEPQNAVYTAECEQWGNVVLKRKDDHGELATEYAFLQAKNGKNCCRVYGYDEKRGYLLEERILPGDELIEERELYVRLEDFARVFEGLHGDEKEVQEPIKHRKKEMSVEAVATHSPGEAEAACFGTYIDWLEQAEHFCEENHVDAEITEKMKRACKFGRELFEKYPDRTLLHGDLHHHNMLLNKEGAYCVIDPKGVIGPAIFDLARFMLNELCYAEKRREREHIWRVTHFLSERLQYPQEDLVKLFFLEQVLANVWCIEDGEEAFVKECVMF